jgi:uncharacterized SAM-binding protein YcdF (DUF218 family)
MSEFVSFLFSVGGVITVILAAILWWVARPHSRLARRLALAVAVLYLFGSIYGVSYAVSRLLVIGFHPLEAADVPAGPAAVVVMGSGSYTIHDWSGRDYSAADPSAASRALEAARVFKLIDAAWVICSGGKLRPDDVDIATGVATSEVLKELGVPAERIVIDTTARNTHEESEVVKAMLPRLNVDHVVLVTTDVHMRRSLGAFRAAGVRAIPAIVGDPFPPRSLKEWVIPGDAGLWSTNLFAHELLGIAYYAVRGWYAF